MFDLYVYDNKELTGVVDGIRSLRWAEFYNDVGETRLDLIPTTRNLALMRLGRVIYNSLTGTAAIIESVRLEDDSGEGSLEVRGRLTSHYLAYRVVMGAVQISNVEEGLRDLITANLRELDISLGPALGLPDTLETERAWGSLIDSIVTVTKTAGLGFRMAFDPQTGGHTFHIYKGVDRTNGGGGYNGYFGDDIRNLLGVELTIDESDYFNVAVVAGAEKDDGSRMVVYAGSPGQGEERREVYVDGSRMSLTYSVARDTGQRDGDGNPIMDYETYTYTDAEYAAILTSYGLERLSEMYLTETVEAELNANSGTMTYGEDFMVGDVVPCKHTRYGVTFDARVTAAVFSVDKDGEHLDLTLGDPVIRRTKTNG